MNVFQKNIRMQKENFLHLQTCFIFVSCVLSVRSREYFIETLAPLIQLLTSTKLF